MTILVVLHFFLAVGLYEVFHTFAPASLPLSAPLATPTSAAPPSPLLLPTSSSLLHWWLSLHKLVVYCPGLLHDNVVLDPCYFGLEHNISPDQSFSLPCSTSSAMCDVFLSGNICPSRQIWKTSRKTVIAHHRRKTTRKTVARAVQQHCLAIFPTFIRPITATANQSNASNQLLLSPETILNQVTLQKVTTATERQR